MDDYRVVRFRRNSTNCSVRNFSPYIIVEVELGPPALPTIGLVRSLNLVTFARWILKEASCEV